MEFPRRSNSIRLKNWDYRSAGAHFLTICTRDRQPLFGRLRDGGIVLSEAGEIVARCWNELPNHFPQVDLDEWMVTPDHFHGILWMNNVPAPVDSTSGSLETIVGSFKSASTRAIHEESGIHDLHVWQRGYHDRIIRNVEELDRIRNYIRENPSRTRERPITETP